MKRPPALVILLFVSCNFVDAQVITSASVVAKGVNGAPATFVTKLSNEGLGFSCDVRLEFVDNANPPNSSNNAIWEVNDDINSGPERIVFSDCPSAGVTFSQTPTTNNSLFEDQTAYVWARKAMVYAQTALWPNSPGKLSTAACGLSFSSSLALALPAWVQHRQPAAPARFPMRDLVCICCPAA